MNKRLTRHEMTQKDEFVSKVELAAGWLEQNWRKVGMTAGGIAAVVLIAAFLVNIMSARGRAADVMLGEAMSLIAADVLQAGQLPPLTGETTFGSTSERDEAVLAKLEELLATYPSSKAAADAAYLRGVTILRLGRAEEARAALEAFVQEHAASHLLPAARRALAAADLESGRSDEALAILQDLADNPSLLFPADAALMELARGQEASGRLDEAQESYRRLAIEHPQSIYAGDATQAVTRLSSPGNAPS